MAFATQTVQQPNNDSLGAELLRIEWAFRGFDRPIVQGWYREPAPVENTMQSQLLSMELQYMRALDIIAKRA